MLPQFVLAGIGPGQFCLTDAHVRVDCHRDASDTSCEEGTADTGDGDNCLDVDASGSPARTQRAPSAPSDMPTVPAVFTLILLPVHTEPNTSLHIPDQLPPPFSAREYCCSIALRC